MTDEKKIPPIPGDKPGQFDRPDSYMFKDNNQAKHPPAVTARPRILETRIFDGKIVEGTYEARGKYFIRVLKVFTGRTGEVVTMLKGHIADNGELKWGPETNQPYDRIAAFLEANKPGEVSEETVSRVDTGKPIMEKVEEQINAGLVPELSDLTYQELQGLAKKEGLNAGGSKDDIMERIKEHFDNKEKENET